MNWQPIRTAPIDDKFEPSPLVLLCNQKNGWVGVGHGQWSERSPVPIFYGYDVNGFGRCKPTHWMPMPEAEAE